MATGRLLLRYVSVWVPSRKRKEGVIEMRESLPISSYKPEQCYVASPEEEKAEKWNLLAVFIAFLNSTRQAEWWSDRQLTFSTTGSLAILLIMVFILDASLGIWLSFVAFLCDGCLCLPFRIVAVPSCLYQLQHEARGWSFPWLLVVHRAS